jgi:hypothetical protein
MYALACFFKIDRSGLRRLTCGFLSGPKGIRTPDLMAASHALYQLSYGPVFLLVRSLTTPGAP